MNHYPAGLPKTVEGIACDIDETVSWTVGFWIKSMQEKFGNPESLSVEEMAMKYKYTQNVPYWNTPETKQFMEEMRNSNEIHSQFKAIPGSSLLNKVSGIIPLSAYLSIRPESVREGTERWIRANDFPEAPAVLRPNEVPPEKGNEWKARVLETLYPWVKGIIDDNEDILSYLSPSYKGYIFLFGHETIPGLKRVKAVPCPKWEDVYESAKKIFGKQE